MFLTEATLTGDSNIYIYAYLFQFKDCQFVFSLFHNIMSNDEWQLPMIEIPLNRSNHIPNFNVEFDSRHSEYLFEIDKIVSWFPFMVNEEKAYGPESWWYITLSSYTVYCDHRLHQSKLDDC